MIFAVLITAAWFISGIAALWLMDERFESNMLSSILLGPFLLLAVLIVMLLDACKDEAREGR